MSRDDSYPYPDYPRTHLNGGAPWVKEIEVLKARIDVLERAVFPNGQARIMPPPGQPAPATAPKADARFHDPDAQLTRGQMGFITDICARLRVEMPNDVQNWTRKQASTWIDANKGRKATA